MTFSGDLNGINLADVFQNIAANRVTGTLHVRWRQTERFVRFGDGAVTGFSLGIGKGLPLLNHLRERGYVDEKQIERLLNKHKRSRKSAGRLILEAGLLNDDDMAGILAEHVEENIFDLMMLREAEFSFSEGEPPSRVFDSDQKSLGLRLEIGPLLMEGARRRDEWERINKLISSDADLFVLLEGWDELDIDEVTAEVAPLLDGSTDIRGVVRQLARSRFAVMKAVSDLVHLGGARPCSGPEIQALAADAIDRGDDEEAVRLLTSALNLERSNQELREQKAELLAKTGRQKDAAAEYALMGHQAAQHAEIDLALRHYGRAVELNPSDVPLLEKRLELLRQRGTGEDVVDRVIELVDLYVEMGLADRARNLLEKTVEQKAFQKSFVLLEKLARVESSLGHWDAAARVFIRLADSTISKDEARGLEYLRCALEQRSDDPALAARIEDIESGRQRRRRARRRRLSAATLGITALLGLACYGWAEITASHQVLSALDQGLGPLRDGEGVSALAELHDVHDRFGWTLAGRRTERLIDRVVNLQLLAIEGLLEEAQYDRATDLLQKVIDELERPDLQATCQSLLDRARTERRAFRILERADRENRTPDQVDLGMIAGLTEGRYLSFLLAHLPRVKNEAVRQAMLSAVSTMDNPRIFPVVARMALGVQDTRSLTAIHKILGRAEAHRVAGREAEWASVYPELEEALLQPGTRGPAQLVLTLLRGTGQQHAQPPQSPPQLPQPPNGR